LSEVVLVFRIAEPVERAYNPRQTTAAIDRRKSWRTS